MRKIPIGTVCLGRRVDHTKLLVDIGLPVYARFFPSAAETLTALIPVNVVFGAVRICDIRPLELCVIIELVQPCVIENLFMTPAGDAINARLVDFALHECIAPPEMYEPQEVDHIAVDCDMTALYEARLYTED